MTPATNAPSAIESPSVAINSALPSTDSSAAATNASRAPSVPMTRNTTGSRNRPTSTRKPSAATVNAATCQPGRASGSGTRESAATIVSSGTMARSWNSSIEKLRSPNAVPAILRSLRSCTTSAVDDRPSGRPTTSAACQLKLVSAITSPVSATPHRMTCAAPSPKISRRSAHNRDG